MGTIREVERKDGTTSFHAEVRLRGYPSQRSSFRTKSLAKKWIQDVESGIRDGRHFKTVEAKRHTVGEMIDRFINQWLPKFPNRQKKQTALLLWWKEQIGHLLLSDLTSSVIAECRDQLLTETTQRGSLRSSSTTNRYLSALSKTLSVAVNEWEWLDDSPIRKVSKPAEGKGRERYLSKEERQRLLGECKNSRNINLFPIVSIALITGMRFGEIVNLRWENLNFERGIITLLETKNGEIRYVPLTKEAEIIFKDCNSLGTAVQSLVFPPSKNTRVKKVISIREAFEAALKRAEIEDFRFHDLRHTAASYMAMSGATQGELMAILGHRTPVMTKRYSHYSQDHLKVMMERTSLNDKLNSETR